MNEAGRSDKPNDPPYGGGEDERPHEERPKPGAKVSEPPPGATTPGEQKLPRKEDA